MNFFFETLSKIFKAFVLIVKHDQSAIIYISPSKAHWLLSWLMVVVSTFIYLLYLPTAFITVGVQESLPEGVGFTAFKAANMISLILVMFVSYLFVYLLKTPLGYMGSVRHYIISQNWLFLLTILIFIPLSNAIRLSEESSFLPTIMIFAFIFILFFAYRCNKLLLVISAPKALFLLLLQLTIELILDSSVDRWFGLVQLAEKAG